MNVLLYTAKNTESGERLQHAIEALGSLESLIDCRTISDLIRHLQSPGPLPETVVLQAADKRELNALASFRFRLEQVFFVLVLPDADAETVARGHQLRPRFIAYQDSDFSEVGAVLDRIESRQVNAARGGIPRTE
ncbi:hypothetical protein [Desulfobulbus elongatus]|uniref:hypothetical protein n=1 Tax=Desulfobulbus elongatus TaxID=53332 RepID=UPI000484E030|nr:hypothetical protein [Desulfobulbus elongatus]